MRFFIFLLLIFPSLAYPLPTVHTITWETGVNKRITKEWSLSLDKTSNVSSSTYIMKKSGGKDPLHSHKHRDVIVWIPDTTDLSRDFISIIWFHGHWGYVPKRTFENRTLKQLVPMTSKNFVLILPEMPWSVHTKTPTKRNSQLWKKPGDFLKFVQQVENLLLKHRNRGSKFAQTSRKKLGKIDYRIVGHSAGGSTIKRLGITGDLCKINPSLVVWSDSSYGLWLRRAWDGCLGNHRNTLVKVFVSKGDSPWKRATQFVGDFQGPIENFELHVKRKPRWTHKLIGDNIVELSNLLGE